MQKMQQLYTKISLFCLAAIITNGNTVIGFEETSTTNINEEHDLVKLLYSYVPEWNMTATQMIRYHGYPTEEHLVTTADGYLLLIHRIPHGKKQYNGKPKNPIIVQHGLLATSASWVLNMPEKNLPYKLADAGYDVWLTNLRGNSYGKQHLTMSADDAEFWNFSFDEMAKYDMPAIIDFIIKTTGSKQLDYVGHSMGTLIICATLSSKPEYNEKIRVAGLLAPLLTLQYSPYPIMELYSLKPYLTPLLKQLIGPKLDTDPETLKRIIAQFCSIWGMSCDTSKMKGILGPYPKHNMTRLPVYINNFPDSTSLQMIEHYSQSRVNSFQMFDYGKLNYRVYGQPKPPKYELSKISTPIFVFWSEFDPSSNPLIVADIIRQISSFRYGYVIPAPRFAHVDYLIATDVDVLVYDEVIKALDQDYTLNDTSSGPAENIHREWHSDHE